MKIVYPLYFLLAFFEYTWYYISR